MHSCFSNSKLLFIEAETTDLGNDDVPLEVISFVLFFFWGGRLTAVIDTSRVLYLIKHTGRVTNQHIKQIKTFGNV